MKSLSENTSVKFIKEDEKFTECYLATRRLIMECDYNTLMEENWLRGKAEGKAEGRAEERRAMAEKMRADGMDEELIRKYTGV